MVRSLLLCCLRHCFCHLLVVFVVVIVLVVVIFVIVVVVVAMAAVARAGARAMRELRQQQQQEQQRCRALGVHRNPPGTIKMILHVEEEERLLRDAPTLTLTLTLTLGLPEERVEAGGRRRTSTSHTLFLPPRWLGGSVAQARWQWQWWGRSASLDDA